MVFVLTVCLVFLFGAGGLDGGVRTKKTYSTCVFCCGITKNFIYLRRDFIRDHGLCYKNLTTLNTKSLNKGYFRCNVLSSELGF